MTCILCVIYVMEDHANGRDGVSNHQSHNCLCNRLFRRRSKKTSKLGVTGLCAGNSPVTGEFPTQRASYAKNATIWWCHHIVWTIWTPMSTVPKKAVKFNHSLTISFCSHHLICCLYLKNPPTYPIENTRIHPTFNSTFFWMSFSTQAFKTLRQRQNGHHFADEIFQSIFFNENGCIFIQIPLQFIPNGRNDSSENG